VIKQIKLSTTNTLKKWECIYNSSSSSTFFHSPSWAFIICKCFPSLQWHTIILEDETNEYLYFEYYKKNISSLFYRESGVPMVYGGLIASDGSNLSTKSIEYLKSLRNRYIIMSPYVDYEPGAPFSGSIETSILELNHEDDPLRNFRKGHKADVKRAQRNDIKIELIQDKEEIKNYFDLYQYSIKRWGRYASGFYPLELFNLLFDHEEYGNTITCYLAKLNDKPIAGAWFLIKDDKVNYWHGAFDNEYALYSPVHGLIYHVIEYYRKVGIRYFDMGPSGGLESLINFKKGFGTRSYEVPYIKSLDYAGRGYRYINIWLEKKLQTSHYKFSII